ncbi:MAG: hypothetical protein Q9213_001116 [Squamulea squamosa]
MRLLERQGNDFFRVSEPFIGRVPPYAILSHTWGSEEVTFQDITKYPPIAKRKAGYRKLLFIADQAAKDKLQYFWVDTCCIDKSSSAELAEAINSMFRWYKGAAKCYVYLADVATPSSARSALGTSRWFTRGWTLQELLAPATVDFFSADHQRIGSKSSLEIDISEITGIPIRALQGQPLSDYSVIERMAWAKKRGTTREEDEAYSLLGIFDVHLPLIYGEGRNAFVRLGDVVEHRSKHARMSSERVL